MIRRAPGGWTGWGSGLSFANAKMRPAPVIVVDEVLKMSIQAALAENDHVIQALAANGADHPFDIGTLPGRPRRRKHLFDAHGLHLVDEILPQDPIVVP